MTRARNPMIASAVALAVFGAPFSAEAAETHLLCNLPNHVLNPFILRIDAVRSTAEVAWSGGTPTMLPIRATHDAIWIYNTQGSDWVYWVHRYTLEFASHPGHWRGTCERVTGPKIPG